MENKNVQYDFSKVIEKDQSLAILPAKLAKQLLGLYASQLKASSIKYIKDQLKDSIDESSTIEEIIEVAQDFINERVLIDNIFNEKWDAYEVKEPLITPLSPTYTDNNA